VKQIPILPNLKTGILSGFNINALPNCAQICAYLQTLPLATKYDVPSFKPLRRATCSKSSQLTFNSSQFVQFIHFQLLRTHNPLVGGSNPSGPTKFLEFRPRFELGIFLCSRFPPSAPLAHHSSHQRIAEAWTAGLHVSGIAGLVARVFNLTVKSYHP